MARVGSFSTLHHRLIHSDERGVETRPTLSTMHPSRWAGTALMALLLGACAPMPPTPTGDRASASAPVPIVPTANLRTVAVDVLEVGPAPDDRADAVSVAPGVLAQGDAVWVLETADDGWSLVTGGTSLDEATMPLGWVPDALDGEPTLAPADVTCSNPPLSVAQLVGLGRFGGLACFGTGPVTLVGFTPLGCGIGGSPRTGTPDWLNGTWSGIGIGSEEPQPPDFDVAAAISARAAPDLGLEPCGSVPGWYRFTGHFDDAASSICRTETTTPDGTRTIEVEPLLSELLCRTQLVLTDAEPLRDSP